MAMNALWIILFSFFGYLCAYRLYGQYISKRVFGCSKERIMPSKAKEDGRDFVPGEVRHGAGRFAGGIVSEHQRALGRSQPDGAVLGRHE